MDIRPSRLFSPRSITLGPFRARSQDGKKGQTGTDGDEGGAGRAYAIQIGCDVAIGIDGGLLAAELDDLANDNDILAHVRVEVDAGDARAGDGLHGAYSAVKMEGRWFDRV